MRELINAIFAYLESKNVDFESNLGAGKYPRHYDLFKEQEDPDTGMPKKHPFKMPAILIDFENEYTEEGDNTSNIRMVLKLHFLQEDYANSAQNSSNKGKAFELLDFIEYTNTLLHGHQFAQGKLIRKRWTPEFDGSNVRHDIVEYELTTKDNSTSNQAKYDETDADGEFVVTKGLVTKLPTSEQSSKFDTDGW